MKQKTGRKLLSFLLALAMLVGLMPGMGLTAYAAPTEKLLTTITATGTEQASYSVPNVATVSFSHTAYGSSVYNDIWGWWGYGWIATVNAAEGYTITKCVFYDDKDRTATDSEDPFVVETTEEDKTPKVNGTPILADTSKGIKKIEVYGYATSAHTHEFTYSADGATITATCGEGCDITEGLTLTISAPTGNLTADGTKTFPATLSTGYNTTAFPGTYAITYTKDGAEFTGTPTEAGEYTASVTVGTATASVSYTVYASKDTQTITASDVTATYGDTDKNVSATTDGNGEISYTVKAGSENYIDVNASTGALTIKAVPADGKAYVTVTASETNTGGTGGKGYAAATKDVTVNISKATVTIAAKDQSIYVGGTVPTLSGVDFYTVTGLVGEETLTTAPTLAYQKNGAAATPDNTTAGTYDIVPSGAAASANYSISYTNGTLTITARNTQSITASDVNATYGDTDKNVSATTDGNGEISYAVKAGSENYIDVNTSTGALTIKAVPADGKAYVTVKATETTTGGTGDKGYAAATKDVTVNISKATVTIAAKDQSIYVGGTVPTLSGVDFYTVTGLVGEETLTINPTLTYQKNGEAATPDSATAGTYDIVPSGAAASDNYSISYTNGTLTISNKGTQTISAENVTATYGDTDKSVSATVTDPATGGGDISYAVKEGSGDYIDVDATTGALTIKKVPADGKAYVTVTAAETATYAQATKDVTVTISKANAVPATVTANNRTYDGTEKPLVTVTGEATGGTMQYALGTATEATEQYTTSIPAKTEAGTYYVWYKVAGDENHNGTESEVLTIKILPVNRDSLISTVSEARAYYNEIKDNDDYAQAAKDLLDAITDAEAVAENDNAKESDIRTALTVIIDVIADTQAKVKDIDAVNAVKNLIDALPSGDTMSTADKDAIAAARKAYEDLTDAQKAKVPADVLKKLTDAETAIETLLKDEADGVAAGKVEKMINALPAANAVKAGDKDAIEAVRKAYEDLTDAQKAKISADVLKKLTDAEQALADTGKKPADLPSDAEAEKQTEISNQKRDEMVDLLNSKGTHEVKGIYQTGYDTVSADYVVTNGKITQMSIDVKGLKEGKNYLTINTGVRLVLGDAFTISGNFVDEKDAKKIAKFVKTKKKEGCVFEPKRLKHYRGGSYEVVLTKGKVELIVDVIDVSLNKKSIKTITLTNAVSQSAVSANAVAADKIGPEGSSVSGNVVTLATSPVFKAEIPPVKDKSARFLSGIWQVGDTFISRGEVKTVTKGKVKVIARANSDGTISIGKADGSGSGSIKISYVLNGKVKKTKNGSKIKSMVYKAKLSVK